MAENRRRAASSPKKDWVARRKAGGSGMVAKNNDISKVDKDRKEK
jgi:hypothetical protein